MENKRQTATLQQVWVFQQNGSGEAKIKGLRQHALEIIELKVLSIDAALPPVIDDTAPWLPERIKADLVLDYLRHPDLSHALAEKCRQQGIAVVASGKKPPLANALTPATCCALTRKPGLGPYGRHFGMPEYAVRVADQRIIEISTLRGAPCGATWEAGGRIIGLTVDEALARIGLEAQFNCVADPSAWDPITGKSPVHIAGDLHKAALSKALSEAGKRSSSNP